MKQQLLLRVAIQVSLHLEAFKENSGNNEVTLQNSCLVKAQQQKTASITSGGKFDPLECLNHFLLDWEEAGHASPVLLLTSARWAWPVQKNKVTV